jgi:hypothetical protein
LRENLVTLVVEKTSIVALHSFSCKALAQAPVTTTCVTKVGLVSALVAPRFAAFSSGDDLPSVSVR